MTFGMTFALPLRSRISAAIVVGLGAALFATAVEARTCAQVQTDLNAQYKVKAMYQGELQRERNPARRAQLIRGIQGFDRNIAMLRAERCDQGASRPVTPPVVRGPFSGGPVRNPPVVRTPPRNCVIGLDGECAGRR